MFDLWLHENLADSIIARACMKKRDQKRTQEARKVKRGQPFSFSYNPSV